MTLTAGPWGHLFHTPPGMARRVLDELEVGHQAAKVWAWTDHYTPPARYAQYRAEQNARARRAAGKPSSSTASIAGPGTTTPLGQLDLFALDPQEATA